MAKLLTLSKAARLLGVTRTALQQEIRDGKLETFEGLIRMSELQRAYPTMKVERSNMLEKLQQIKDNAVNRRQEELPLTDIDKLNSKLDAVQRQSGSLQLQLQWYLSTLDELVEMLDELQDNANSEQLIMIASIRTWLRNKLEH